MLSIEISNFSTSGTENDSDNEDEEVGDGNLEMQTQSMRNLRNCGKKKEVKRGTIELMTAIQTAIWLDWRRISNQCLTSMTDFSNIQYLQKHKHNNRKQCKFV